jgi:hypothetical protein
MSRDDEDRILHGLYYYRENIDEDVQVSSEQLLWLAMNPLRDGEAWYKNGKLQRLDASEFPEEIRAKLITAKLELPLRYLQYRRLIKYARRSDGMLYAAVTFAGADRAIRLHTRRGRLDLWYRENKDGIVGVTTTVFIAFVTALATVLIAIRVLKP